MAIQPERLQLLAARIFINNIPLHFHHLNTLCKNGQYIGGPGVSKDVLRIVGEDRFSEQHVDLIMDIFTYMLNHSSVLRFPASKYLPTTNQLENHLHHHGESLTELSIVNCFLVNSNDNTDSLLETIGKNCSSLLKHLTLPGCIAETCITERGVNALITSKFCNSLQRLDVSSLTFSSTDILLQLLSSLSNLKRLNLSDVKVLRCNQKLPIPLNGCSLPHLEHLNIYNFQGCLWKCMCLDSPTRLRSERLESDWIEFWEKYTGLKTLQIYGNTCTNTSLLAVSEGLKKRKTPLEYLGIHMQADDEYQRWIIQKMRNVDKITTGVSISELRYELETRMRDYVINDSAITDYVFFKLEGVWQKSREKDDLKIYRDMLVILKLLIPQYKHLPDVFHTCTSALCYMVENPWVRKELNLTPSVIETFITLIMCPENDNFGIDRICDILAIYKNSISVPIYDKVMKMFIKQQTDSFAYYKKVVRYTGDQSYYINILNQKRRRYI